MIPSTFRVTGDYAYHLVASLVPPPHPLSFAVTLFSGVKNHLCFVAVLHQHVPLPVFTYTFPSITPVSFNNLSP